MVNMDGSQLALLQAGIGLAGASRRGGKRPLEVARGALRVAGGRLERRQSRRVEMKCPITIFDSHGQAIATGQTTDVGSTGAAFWMPAVAIASGMCVEVVFCVPQQAGPPRVHCRRASVVRLKASRSGRRIVAAIRFDKRADLAL